MIEQAVVSTEACKGFRRTRRDVAFVLLPAHPSGDTVVIRRTHRPVALRPVAPLTSAARPYPCLLVIGARSPLIALPFPTPAEVLGA
jgi:hypothetical protein